VLICRINPGVQHAALIEDIDLDEGEVAVVFNGRTVTVALGEVDTIVPAYAATIHKSLGSEYPAVVRRRW
jgi:exodeoxyribonuclease V alpha subunit